MAHPLVSGFDNPVQLLNAGWRPVVQIREKLEKCHKKFTSSVRNEQKPRIKELPEDCWTRF
eukprot:184477-Prorocentrum_minimum.AAC.2